MRIRHPFIDSSKELAFQNLLIQGGAYALDALSYRSLSAKEPLSIGLFCGK